MRWMLLLRRRRRRLSLCVKMSFCLHGGAGELGAEKGAHLVAVVALRWKCCFSVFSAIYVLCDILTITYATILIHGRVAAFILILAPLCSRVAPFPATRPLQAAMTFTRNLVP